MLEVGNSRFIIFLGRIGDPECVAGFQKIGRIADDLLQQRDFLASRRLDCTVIFFDDFRLRLRRHHKHDNEPGAGTGKGCQVMSQTHLDFYCFVRSARRSPYCLANRQRRLRIAGSKSEHLRHLCPNMWREMVAETAVIDEKNCILCVNCYYNKRTGNCKHKNSCHAHWYAETSLPGQRKI